MIEVTIKECYGEHRSHTSNHRTTDPAVAIERAVRRHYGNGSFFREEHGLPGYGQIWRRIRRQSTAYTSETGRVRVETKNGGAS